MRGAVLFPQSWTGALTFMSHNVPLIALDPAEFDTHISGMIHELAHLAVGQVVDCGYTRLEMLHFCQSLREPVIDT